MNVWRTLTIMRLRPGLVSSSQVCSDSRMSLYTDENRHFGDFSTFNSSSITQEPSRPVMCYIYFIPMLQAFERLQSCKANVAPYSAKPPTNVQNGDFVSRTQFSTVLRRNTIQIVVYSRGHLGASNAPSLVSQFFFLTYNAHVKCQSKNNSQKTHVLNKIPPGFSQERYFRPIFARLGLSRTQVDQLWYSGVILCPCPEMYVPGVQGRSTRAFCYYPTQ